MFKKLACLILTGIVAVGLLAACNAPDSVSQPDAASGSGAASDSGAASAGAESADAGIDISKEVSLFLYLLGDEPADLGIVYDELNGALKEKINATLKTSYLSWGDWQTKYSLILAGGENVDMIYTSDWAHYGTESAKGAFYELTDDFMNTYMPMTVKSQEPASLMQATINGKLFAVPKNSAGLEGETWIVIRKDLREKYGMEEPKNIGDLEAYFSSVVENESGLLPYAASADGGFERIAWTQPKQLVFIANTDFCYEYKGTPDAPDSSDFTYKWFRDDAIPYFELMKKWNDMGFWSKNAISNTEQVRDSFENGKSASLTWNSSVFLAGKTLKENNPDWDFEVLDINPDTMRTRAMYTNDCIAIAAASKNPERAAMFIDLIKSDIDVYKMLVGGIEGKHYIINEDGTRTAGPDADKYPWNPGTWCFNLTPGTAPDDADVLPNQLAFETQQLEKAVDPATTAFRFDVEPVKNELAAVNALRDEIKPTLALGIAEDIETTVADWKAKAEAAGLGKIVEEFTKQYDAWKASL